jgi:hypothetical protein
MHKQCSGQREAIGTKGGGQGGFVQEQRLGMRMLRAGNRNPDETRSIDSELKLETALSLSIVKKGGCSQ